MLKITNQIFRLFSAIRLSKSTNSVCKYGVVEKVYEEHSEHDHLFKRKVILNSQQAHDYLSKCDTSFVERFIEKNFDDGEKMHPILNQLELKSPEDWESKIRHQLYKSRLRKSGMSEDVSESLELCITDCYKILQGGIFSNSYHENYEDFKAGNREQPMSCPKCVKFLPVDKILMVDDALWGFPPRTTTKPGGF